MNKINVGIIGLGHMGMLHLMNCYHIDFIEVVAAADKSKNALKKVKSKGVKNTYDDYQDMLTKSRDLDAVIISLPNYLHHESIELALESGLNVFVEKPLANTIDECNSILRLVKKSNKKLMIGHNYRYFDAIQKMKAEVDMGKIGNIEVLTAELVINGPFSHPAVPKPVPEWWFDPNKTGGGVVHDLGYHLFDFFRFFVGEADVIFSCLDHKLNFEMEDGAIVLLKAKDSETKGIINVGWYQKTVFPRFNFRMILHGDAGYLSTEEYIPKNLYVHAIKTGLFNSLKKVFRKKIMPLSYTYFYDSYYKELDDFFTCIKNDVDPEISAYDGYKTIEIIKEVYNNSKISW